MKITWLVHVSLFISACITNTNGQDNCPLKILPESGSVKSWMQKAAPECFTNDKLFEAINGAAEVYLEYGFVSMARSSYSSRKQTLDIEVYQMANSDAAFGILTDMYDGPPLEPVDGTLTIMKSYYGMAAKGRYFIIVTEPTGKGGVEGDINKFIIDVTSRIQENASIPELIDNLQIEDITRIIYFNGDLVLNNLFYLGITRPFHYEHGIYFETKGISVVVFKCNDDIPLTENIYSTLERFKESGKYNIDHQNNRVTNMKGRTFRLMTEGNKIILLPNALQDTIARPGFKFWKD